MTRRRSLLAQVDRDAYLVSRTAGDVRTAERGPKPLAKRVVRRQLTRAFFRALRSATK